MKLPWDKNRLLQLFWHVVCIAAFTQHQQINCVFVVVAIIVYYEHKVDNECKDLPSNLDLNVDIFGKAKSVTCKRIQSRNWAGNVSFILKWFMLKSTESKSREHQILGDNVY